MKFFGILKKPSKEVFSVGLAMFAMFFGAGNIIFPLAIGQLSGDKSFFSILGLILTGVIVPFSGVFAMILFEGDQKRFFGRMGKIPGFLVAFLTIVLLGPLGSTPRCIALTYASLQNILPNMSISIFGAIACIVIYFSALSKKRLISVLGVILTPLLLICLLSIVILGFSFPSNISSAKESGFELFIFGLKEGYNTMDLLAAFFFSSTIWGLLKESKDRYVVSLQASLIAMFLLILIYTGFCYIAAMHGGDGAKDEILSRITSKLAGPYAGGLVSITIGLACLTTAIALISAFSDFVFKEVFSKKVDYRIVLGGSLFITFIVSTFKFNGISAFLGPVLQIIYPGLIVLTIFNLTIDLKKKVLS